MAAEAGAMSEQVPTKDQVCKCVPDSWNGTPNAICSACKPDPIAPEYCMNCEHDVACHDQFSEIDPIVYEQMTRAGVTT